MGILTIDKARKIKESARLNANQRSMLRDIESGSCDMKIGALREALGSDVFDAINLDASHNSVQAGYGSVPDHWRKLCVVKSTRDFKNVNVSSLAGFAPPPEVPQNSLYPEAVLSDQKITYPIKKYGDILRLSLEAMMNDEMGAFQQNAFERGKAFATGLNEFVIGTNFDDSPTFEVTGNTLWGGTGHNNKNTGSGLSLATVETAIAKLMAQTGRAGEQIYLYPKYIVCSPSLMMQANDIVRSQTKVSGVTTTGGLAAGNTIASLGLEVIVSPHINGTATTWYLLSGPMIEMSFVGGKTEPEVFIEPDNTGTAFSMDATSVKMRMCYGGEVFDFRQGVQSTVA